MAEIVSYSRVVHFGVILPNYGLNSNPDGIRRVAEAAEELGFDSVWATEHIIVAREAVDPYGRVYAPLVTLAWIAGWTERIGLGTSIVLVPLTTRCTWRRRSRRCRSSQAAASRSASGWAGTRTSSTSWASSSRAAAGVPTRRSG